MSVYFLNFLFQTKGEFHDTERIYACLFSVSAFIEKKIQIFFKHNSVTQCKKRVLLVLLKKSYHIWLMNVKLSKGFEIFKFFSKIFEKFEITFKIF
jgi:hypothetical protein